ncbi:MAG: transporter associated domain-containing protein [Coxiellaceae bacterium]|nr:transporter associated domain-containing protein [Coxiellaceae bacterium]
MTTEDPQKSWVERLSEALLREPQTQAQLLSLLHDAKDRELIDPSALEMIESILRFSELHARDVMIPRGQMVVLEHDAPREQILSSVIQTAHSRFPVINESRDEIIGILLAKELLPTYLDPSKEEKPLEALLRPATFVPESKRLDALLKDFRQKRNHMAIVIDEYGGVSGLVTIEDVLEEIVGDIVDETDATNDEPNINPVDKNTYLINALTPIEDFNAYFHVNLSDEDYDTIGGLVIQQFGYLPLTGEQIIIDNFDISVVSADSRRLTQLRVIYTIQS